MVKSNKFDYTGRTSSGPKLGKSIASDLEKRADKKRRDTQKLLSAGKPGLKSRSHHSSVDRPRKEHESSRLEPGDYEDRQAQCNEPKHDATTKLDIKVPSKALTDEGFGLVCDSLKHVLQTCPDMALVDLNISDNDLTTGSLARLAPIICLSKYTLQDLDLSRNRLKVTTTTEARDWEMFLSAFGDCMTLRRLDLSDNAELGSWAMELLARVYNRERHIEPVPALGARSTITLPDDQYPDATSDMVDKNGYGADGDAILEENDYGEQGLPRSANGKTLADTWIIPYRRGLRSLPYLTLSNIGLTDAGALFLSYVVEQHYYPTQLVTEINAAEATTQIQAYSQDANLKGINWDNNMHSLGRDGHHLLQCTEKYRLKTLLEDTESISGSVNDSVRPSDSSESGSIRQATHIHLTITLTYRPCRKVQANRDRRTSIRSTHSAESSAYDRSDMISARRKVQRNTIAQAGGSSVEFWQSALRIIASSRLLLLVAPQTRELPQVPSPLFDGQLAESPTLGASQLNTSASMDSFSSYVHLPTKLYGLNLEPKATTSVELDSKSKASYAATLRRTSSSSTAESALAANASSGVHKATLRHENNMTVPSTAREEGVERDNSDERYKQYQIHHMLSQRAAQGRSGDGYRDFSTQCHLPLSVCIEVVRHALGTDVVSALTEEQQRMAIVWSQNRETLGWELEWRKKDESSQILMLLAGAKCVDC